MRFQRHCVIIRCDEWRGDVLRVDLLPDVTQ